MVEVVVVMEDVEAFQGFDFQSFPQKWGIELTRAPGVPPKCQARLILIGSGLLGFPSTDGWFSHLSQLRELFRSRRQPLQRNDLSLPPTRRSLFSTHARSSQCVRLRLSSAAVVARSASTGCQYLPSRDMFVPTASFPGPVGGQAARGALAVNSLILEFQC